MAYRDPAVRRARDRERFRKRYDERIAPGLCPRCGEIVQFAAVLTDSDLNDKDRIELGCRLMPHVIPSPESMHVTGLRIEQLLDASLPSHYEMVTEVRRILEPSIAISGLLGRACGYACSPEV